VPGICGIVNGSIMPGYYGIEAGQSAVGDILRWWVDEVCLGRTRFTPSSRPSAASRARCVGLLALDWNNGNRTILVGPAPERSAARADAPHHARRDLPRAHRGDGVRSARSSWSACRSTAYPSSAWCAAGIAEKNELFMQIYADVLGHPMLVAGSPQTPALGSAISAAVAAVATRASRPPSRA
jgi:L-ribulokinase